MLKAVVELIVVVLVVMVVAVVEEQFIVEDVSVVAANVYNFIFNPYINISHVISAISYHHRQLSEENCDKMYHKSCLQG